MFLIVGRHCYHRVYYWAMQLACAVLCTISVITTQLGHPHVNKVTAGRKCSVRATAPSAHPARLLCQSALHPPVLCKIIVLLRFVLLPYHPFTCAASPCASNCCFHSNCLNPDAFRLLLARLLFSADDAITSTALSSVSLIPAA